MDSQGSADLNLLLQDYSKSLERRVLVAKPTQWPPSDQPLWLQVRDFDRRLRGRRGVGPTLPPSEVPPPELLSERFDPLRRFRAASGPTTLPPDTETPVDLETRWASQRVHRWTLPARACSLVLHIAVAGLLLIPGTMQLDMTKPVDWDSLRITLMAPPLDDLPPLSGQSEIQGEGEGGFRGLPQPPAMPTPEPDPLPPTAPAPEPEPEPSVAQPLEVDEPETPEEIVALEEPERPVESETPVAQSPAPGAFREGRELAKARDPRLLPMPAAPARKRPALQLEDPKARMPSRTGDAQLGSLDLTARPDRVIEGALQQLIRGEGGRQVVGDGIGGFPSAGVLPPGPANSGSLVELLSDPRGVDFRPYLTQILAVVRRNWFAVIPESARLGMSRGRTLIQFSVARNGSVPKLVIAKPSGTPPLDRAAVAGISASNPFPPLPGEFGGNTIRLQFTFQYNIRNP